MRRHALFVGVDHYKEPLLSLSCAISDAAKMCGLFENALGFETRLLSDPSSEDVKNAIRDITSNLRYGDVFLFYFAGHGFTPISGGRQTLVCSSDEYDDVCQNWAGVPFDYIDDKTVKGGYSRVFVIDACRSALLPSRSIGADTRDLMPAAEYLKERKGPAPYFLIQSCRRGQSALEVKSKGRGLFSLALQDLIKETVCRQSAFSFSHSLTCELQKRMKAIAAAEGMSTEQVPDPAGDDVAICCPVGSGSKQVIPEVQTTTKVEHKECKEDDRVRISSSVPDAPKIACDVEELREIATSGDAHAQYLLGQIYAIGDGVVQSCEEALKWYRKAAEIGDANAQKAIGDCCFGGDGVAQSYAEAVTWYRKAAKNGSAEAQYVLGKCYFEGIGVGQAFEEAAKWYSKSAQLGCADAQYALGCCYWRGAGVSRSSEQALKWWREAAEQENCDAQKSVGDCYYEGDGAPRSYKEAVKWYRRAAERGHGGAQYSLAICYCMGRGAQKSEEEWNKWVRIIEESGDAATQKNLGDRFYDGDPFPRSYEKAAKLYRLAADKGFSDALKSLADCYERGEGVPQSHLDAAKCLFKAAQQRAMNYRESAERGDASATFNLGQCYERGDGVQQSLEEAIKCYRAAAGMAYWPAEKRLGECFYKGIGVERSDAESIKWFSLAAEHEGASPFGTEWFSFGEALFYGKGMPQSRENAVKWYRKAAEYHCEDAMLKLGDCYFDGVGVSRSYSEAVKWYRSAWSKLNGLQLKRVGDCYFYGHGVAQSYEEALNWYGRVNADHDGESQEVQACTTECLWLLSKQGKPRSILLRAQKCNEAVQKSIFDRYRNFAEQGDRTAMENLAFCYQNGIGVSQSYAEAKKWENKTKSIREKIKAWTNDKFGYSFWDNMVATSSQLLLLFGLFLVGFVIHRIILWVN